LGAPWSELPWMREVFGAAHPKSGSYDIGKLRVIGSQDEVAAPGEHQPGGIDRSLDLREGNLAEVSPAQRGREEVLPLLEEPFLGSESRPTVNPDRPVLTRSRLSLDHGFG